MPLQKNLNVSPYYADYNPLSDYYKVLFKAGYPVQARELTNLQLMMQNQIETFMSRFLKEGDQVVPGEFGYAQSSYVRVASITQGSSATDFVGYTLTGAVSGVKAFVNFATPETSADDVTFYVNYEDSGTTGEYETFIEGEILESDTPNRLTATVGINSISKPISSSPLGKGSLFTVKEGYYFVDGTSVRVEAQTITLDKYGIRPTYNVGFLVTEEFISSVEDPALLDNSQGSANFAAPGADRLKITLTLVKRLPDEVDPNFILLSNIVQGTHQGKPDQRTKWAWLYELLAKRTFDESGNYIVTAFPLELLEYGNDDLINGLFNEDDDGLYPPVPGTGDLERQTPEQAFANYVIKLSEGLAYVQGYEVGITQPAYIYGAKPRQLDFRGDVAVAVPAGENLALQNINSTPDFNNIQTDSIDTLGLETITLYRNYIDGYVGDSTTLDESGSYQQPFNIGNPPPVTYHIQCAGDIGTISASAPYSVIYKAGNSCVVTTSLPPKRGDEFAGTNIVSVIKINPTPSGALIPKYLLPQAVVENATFEGSDNPGALGYNSTYNLGVTAAAYYTELILLADDSTTNYDSDWVIGDQVIGQTTAAIGVVEAGSIPQRVIVSNVVGEFAPGEYISQGNKVSKVATQGEVLGFNFTNFGFNSLGTPLAPSASDLSGEQTIKVSAIGAEITLVKGSVPDYSIPLSGQNIQDFFYDAETNSLIPTYIGRQKLRNFPYPEGSVLATRINYALKTSPSNIDGYAVTINGKLINALDKTKSLYANLDPTQNTNFSADISTQNNRDSEVVPLADGSLFSGAVGNNFIKCDDFSGDPAEQLVFGDVVTFVDDTGTSVSKLVYFATKPVGYGDSRDSSYIYFTTTLENGLTGKTVQRLRIKKKGSASDTNVYELPEDAIKSLQSDSERSGINYSVMQEFVVDVTGGATVTSFTISTNKSNETFIGNSSQITITVGNLPSDVSDSFGLLGRQLAFTAQVNADGTMTITLAQPLRYTATLKILAPVFVTNAVARVKTIVNNQELIVNAEDAARDIISLGRADVFLVTSVKTPDGNEVFGNYIFDDGMRDNVYEISRLILKPGAPPSETPLTITYDYFAHSGDGDFFSVDSYASENAAAYDLIPTYFPQKKIFSGSQDGEATCFDLRDVLDFRPVVNTEGTTGSYISLITPQGDATSSTNFRGVNSRISGNGIVPRFLIPGTLFVCDLEYYLPRVDSLFIEKSGALRLVQGTPARQPQIPPDQATALRLYDIYLPAYTFSVQEIYVKKYDYQRFTMADIADITERVTRVEDLITLSLLEQSALNMQVRDAVTGLNRFKNGIIVDRFANHSLGEAGQEQYRCSIDPVSSHLRAPHYTDQIELIENNQLDGQRASDGYRKSGPLLTCFYESERFMQNPYATRFINLQPYTVFTFDGVVELTPSVDTFQDITKLPDLVIEDNTVFNALTNLTQTMAESGIGLQWGEWENDGRSRQRKETVSVFKLKGKNGKKSKKARRAQIASLQIAHGVNVDQITTGTPAAQARLDAGKSTRVRVFDQVTEIGQTRKQTDTQFQVNTKEVKDTSYGERVVDVQLQKTMRTIPVRVQAGRLKENTRYYIYFDEIEVSSWFSPDTIYDGYPDGKGRYSGQPGSSQIGFGEEIYSDDVGNLSGLFLIPNGRAPATGQVFTNLQNVVYQSSGPTRSFNTGTRQFKITSSPLNASDLDLVEGFAQTTFVSSGVLLDKQETIVSTRIPETSFTKEVVATQQRWKETQRTRKAEYFDPVAQTFLVDGTRFEDGIFVTELDVFFKKKDEVEGVEAYLTTTEGQVPTEQIIPFSRVVKNTDTTLRTIVSLPSSSSAFTLEAGTIITGQTSGSTGIIKSTMNFESPSQNPTRNTSNTVYNVLLDNYDGEFIEGETFVPSVTPATTAVFTIVSDTLEIESVTVTSLGAGYHAPTVTFSAPELPGGVTATGTASVGYAGSNTVAGDVIYEIKITNKGSGYTTVPSVTITDTIPSNIQGATNGNGCEAVVNVSNGTKAVDMGVSTSEDATAVTKFKFHAPVYLLSDTNYAFVLKAPTSLNYECYTSKMGENEIGTQIRVVQQPNLGSLFKSQNGGLWTEDQTQDIKFVMHKAKFNTNSVAGINLVDAPIAPKKTLTNPIETNGQGADLTSDLFGDNPLIARIFLAYHGLAKGDAVILDGVVNNPGGFPNDAFNTVHTVVDAGIEFFTIRLAETAKPATVNSERDGGSAVFVGVNRPYEALNVYTGAMLFGSSTLTVTNTATQGPGPGGYNVLRQYQKDLPNEITLMDTYYYDGAKLAASAVNEAKYNGSIYLRGTKSFDMNIVMSTIDENVSPVIDLDRTNANLIRNLIDAPLPTESLNGVRSATITLNGSPTSYSPEVESPLVFTKDSTDFSVTIKSFNPDTRRIRVQGQHVGKLEGATFKNTELNSLGANHITTSDGRLWVPETSPNGTAYAKFISRQFQLENPCDGIEMKLSAVYYANTDIRAYYRPSSVGFEGDLTQEGWIPFNPDQELEFQNNIGQISRVVYPGLPDNVNDIIVRDSTEVDPRLLEGDDFVSITFTVQDIPAFDSVAIKIVMTSVNPAKAPLIDDMQLVCSE